MRSVILLPGLACDEEVFRDQAEALRSRGPVHVSDAHTRCATLPAMAAALWAERPGPQVLVGTSMGGMVALEMARQAPQRVRGIALLGSTARPDTPELVALRTQAWRLGIAYENQQVTAHYLAQLHTDRCAVLRTPLGGSPGQPDAAVVERLNPQAGYAAGNLALLSQRAVQARAGVDVLEALRRVGYKAWPYEAGRIELIERGGERRIFDDFAFDGFAEHLGQ